jgi:hypothetical protein
MRLLVVNVNTTTSMTDQIAARRSRLLRLAPRSSGSPLHWRWERSSTWPWPGDDCQSSPPKGSAATKQPNPHEPAGHRGPANRVIRERVTNMAIGTGLDNITELRSSPCRGEDAPTAISLLD